jgi:penicillin G amidase
MRATWVGCLFLSVFIGACHGASSAPTLTIQPSGTVQVAGSQLFTATVQNTEQPVNWTLSGPGTLSSASGYETSYIAPALLGGTPVTATLTASVAGLTQTANLTVAPPSLTPGTISGLSAPVKVEYDAQQIPHIFCAAANDCYAVQGYLQAKDRLFSMDLLRRTARGQLASMIGPLQVSSDEQFLSLFVTRTGQRIEDALVAAASPSDLALLTAYSNGVNAWLAVLGQNPNLIPGEYAQLPTPITNAADIPQWTPQDTLALGRLEQFELSENIGEEIGYGQFAQTYGPGAPLADPGKMNSWIRCKEPVHAYTTNPGTVSFMKKKFASLDSSQKHRKVPALKYASSSKHVTPSKPDPWGELYAAAHKQIAEAHQFLGRLGLGIGSNNWVIDAAHSATGKAMVANDPHLPLAYPPLFHLAAMTASDSSGLDVSGGAFPGVPGALVGRGKHVGWGVTTVGYDVTDEYNEVLTTDALLNPAVVYQGKIVKLTQVHYTIKVRGGTDVPYTVYVVPHHGPLIAANQNAGTALSLRWTGHEPIVDLGAFIGLDTATEVGNIGDYPPASTSAFAALSVYATGAQNFVLADDQGNIGYDPHAIVPKRPWAGSAPNGIPLLPWMPLPGDGSAEWGTGVATDDCNGTPKAACWVADTDLPYAVNPPFGFLTTANSDPNGDSDDNDAIHNPPDPTVPSYLSFDWDDPTGFRVARIAQMIEQATADGGTVSLDQMQAMQTDHTLTIGEVFLPFLEAVPTAMQSPSYQTGLAILQQWGQDNYDCPTGLSGIDPAGAPDTNPVHVRDSSACLLFHSFLTNLLDNVFDDDLAITGQTPSEGPAVRAMLYMLEPTTPASDQTFCNNVDSSGHVVATLTCVDQLQVSLSQSVDFLTQAFGAPSNWIWGRVHTLTTQSLAAPLIGPPYQAGPWARPGGGETVDVGDPDSTSSNSRVFSYSAGSNVRHISVMDPANPIVKMQLPGLEHDTAWGLVASTPADMLTPYVQNQYFDYLRSTQIDAQNGVVSVETFTP